MLADGLVTVTDAASAHQADRLIATNLGVSEPCQVPAVAEHDVTVLIRRLAVLQPGLRGRPPDPDGPALRRDRRERRRTANLRDRPLCTTHWFEKPDVRASSLILGTTPGNVAAGAAVAWLPTPAQSPAPVRAVRSPPLYASERTSASSRA